MQNCGPTEAGWYLKGFAVMSYVWDVGSDLQDLWFLKVLGDVLCIGGVYNLWRHMSNLQDLLVLGVPGDALCISGWSGHPQSGEFRVIYCTS